MRRIQSQPRTRDTGFKDIQREIHVEGIQKRKRHTPTNWKSMSDDKLIAYANEFVKANGCKNRNDIKKLGGVEGRRLYFALWKRKLFDRVDLDQQPKETRKWALMSDNELLDYAKKFVIQIGAKKRIDIRERDGGLYAILCTRKIIDLVGFERDEKIWSRYNDNALVDLAKKIAEENGIKTRSGLAKEYGGLYDVLIARGLIERVICESSRKKERQWIHMEDTDIIQFAKNLIKKKGITDRSELRNADTGLYQILKKRELLDRLGLQIKKRLNGFFSSMSNEALLEYLAKFTDERSIKSKKELRAADSLIYEELKKRDLFGIAGFEDERRKWASMSDKEILVYAKKLIKARSISSKSMINKVDSSFYGVLISRKLLDKLGLENVRRNWSGLNDNELLDYAKEFFKENSIDSFVQIQKADSSLYAVLRERSLLASLGFKTRRDFLSMNDDEIINMANELIKAHGLCTRSDLQKADGTLYQNLTKRNLLESLGLSTPVDWVSKSDNEIIEITKKYMKEKKITKRNELRKLNPSIYSALCKRKLLDQIGFEDKRRNWRRMSDKEIFEHAGEYIKEKMITRKKELLLTNPSLFKVLRDRKLLSRVFYEIEQSRETNILSQLRAAVDLYTGKGEKE